MGVTEGLAEGSFVGTGVGSDVLVVAGDPVGAAVGAPFGLVVGLAVGEALVVGLAVSGAHTAVSNTPLSHGHLALPPHVEHPTPPHGHLALPYPAAHVYSQSTPGMLVQTSWDELLDTCSTLDKAYGLHTHASLKRCTHAASPAVQCALPPPCAHGVHSPPRNLWSLPHVWFNVPLLHARGLQTYALWVPVPPEKFVGEFGMSRPEVQGSALQCRVPCPNHFPVTASQSAPSVRGVCGVL